MSQQVEHGTFSIQRIFDAPVERLYEAFADKQAKERWFFGGNNPNEHEMEFRVGGQETNQGRFHDGKRHRFVATYYDIVPNERIIYTYEMFINDRRISVSLAILEFQAQGDNNSSLTLTENGAFLDGLDTMESRQRGTNGLLDAIAKTLT